MPDTQLGPRDSARPECAAKQRDEFAVGLTVGAIGLGLFARNVGRNGHAPRVHLVFAWRLSLAV